MKRCTVCLQEKDESEFYARKRSKDGLNYACKVCAKKGVARHKKREYEYARALGADARKDANLKRHYKMSLREYDAMLAAQASSCAICGRKPEEFNRAFAVDHDHASGLIRGILCPDCNRGLGGFHDSVELLTKAIDYLKSSAQE